MCGIGGEIRFGNTEVQPNRVSKMLEAMRNRGPDGSGIYLQKNLCFGHRRLKIIDLSDRAHQPMVDNELGLGLVFNGCIYNYRELKAELEKKNYTFFSEADTEVLIKAYHCWGPEFVKRLEGMFAFAIWERDSKVVYLFRDRLGIKPLYYSEVSDGLLFASSLPALLKAGVSSEAIDTEALQFYLSFHSVVPAPLSIFEKIRKLPPASIMRIAPSGSIEIQSYWDLNFKINSNRTFADTLNELNTTMKEAVHKRTIADVPIGVLLSGGLDSSLIVGILSQLGHSKIETFSIGFEAENQELGDEFKYSDIVANEFKTTHHKIFISGTEILEKLGHCVSAMSEPMVSHDNIGFYLLSREVRKYVTVVLSGQGADEVFAGYHWYPPMIDSKDAVSTYSNYFLDRDFSEYQEVVNPNYLLNHHAAREFIERHFQEAGNISPVDKALRLDTQVMLVEDPVKRVDNMTMAWGLEARVPFLDHKLVEFAATIPAEWKLKNGGKYVLKELARSYIPAEVIDRPKGYFPVPQLKYIRGPFLSFVREILSQKSAQERGLFNSQYVNRLLKNPDEHITPLKGSKLWQLSLLEYWLQCHVG